MRLVATVLALMLIGAVGVVQAGKLYKWVDRDGNVSYHDRPPPTDGSYRVEEKNVRGEGARAAAGADDVAEKFPVVLYTAAGCDSCNSARAYLQKRGVPFKEVNLEGGVEVQQAAKKKIGSLSVPTLTVGEKVMRGYIESLLEGELDAVGYPKPEATAAGDKEAAKDEKK